MSERLTRRLAALESKAGAADRAPIRVIRIIVAPDGTVLGEYERPYRSTEEVARER
jgi:hypothetical protein